MIEFADYQKGKKNYKKYCVHLILSFSLLYSIRVFLSDNVHLKLIPSFLFNLFQSICYPTDSDQCPQQFRIPKKNKVKTI